jgi:hypothetical protein
MCNTGDTLVAEGGKSGLGDRGGGVHRDAHQHVAWYLGVEIDGGDLADRHALEAHRRLQVQATDRFAAS